MERVDRVVLIRLTRPAHNSDELHQVTRFVDQCHRDCGRPVIMLALPSPGMSPPDEHIRSLVVRNIKQRFHSGVIEHALLAVPAGNAIARAMVRSIFTGARLLLGLPNRIQIVESYQEASRIIAERFGIPEDQINSHCEALLAQTVT